MGHVHCFAPPCRVERCEIVVANPVDVGAAVEEVVGGGALAAVAGEPECLGDFFGGPRLGRVLEVARDAIHQAQRGGLPEVGLGTALDQSPRGFPLAEGHGVGQRCATGDDGAVGFDIGAEVEQLAVQSPIGSP